MNRRLFLKNSGHFGIGLSVLGSLPLTDLLMDSQRVTPDHFRPFFQLSLAQWSLHKAILETKTLSNLDFALKARELGFEGVEYVSQLYPLDENNLAGSLDKYVMELKSRSADSGMTNVLIMVDNEGELAALGKQERDQAIGKHVKWVDAAAALGCHSIRVNLFGQEAEKDFEVWKDTAADGLGRLTEYAMRSKINVIVENHGGLSSNASKLVSVVRSVNLPNCGLLPDFGNFCTERDSGERWGGACKTEYDKYVGVQEMMPLAKGVSAKSYAFDKKGNETTIDYTQMMSIVKDSGYRGFIGVEYEGDKLDEISGIIATKNLLLKSAQLLEAKDKK